MIRVAESVGRCVARLDLDDLWRTMVVIVLGLLSMQESDPAASAIYLVAVVFLVEGRRR